MGKLIPASAGQLKTLDTVEDYLGNRILGAKSSGYNSVKIWIKNVNKAEALGLLEQAGYKIQTVAEEPKSTQLLVSW